MLDREEDVRLAKNFTLNELVKSSTADRMGIDNWPEDDTHLVNITNVANHILQPVRDEWGATRINSGYRSPKLNKAVGGATKNGKPTRKALALKKWGFASVAAASVAAAVLNPKYFKKSLLEWLFSN